MLQWTLSKTVLHFIVYYLDSPHCSTAGTRVVELDLGEEAELECSMGWDRDLELDWTVTSHLDRYYISYPLSGQTELLLSTNQ